MAQSSFSNLFSDSGYKPLNIALSNKISPSPLSPALNFNSALSSGGLKINSSPGVSPDKIPGATPPGTIGASDAARGVGPAAVKQVATPAPSTSGNAALKAALQAHLATLQSQLKDQQARDQEAQTNSAPGNQAQPSAFSSLVQQGTKAATQAAELQQKGNENENDVYANPNYSLDTQVGRAGLIDKNVGQRVQGLSQQAQAAYAGAQAVAPVLQFGQLTDPTTGKVIGAGTSGNNPQLESAVQNAIKLVQNGTDPKEAMSTLGGFGQAGTNAFNQAMLQVSNGTYNPTALSAAVAQNNSQGQTYQGEATQLSTTLKQLDTLAPTVTQFLQKSGLNSQDNPFFNKSLQTYMSQLGNPADVASLNAMLADVKTYTAQILGSSGLNPTEVSQTVNSFDPSQLNGTQLTSFLANLKNLGQTRLQPLQQSAASSYGSSGANAAFAGAPATPSTESTYAAPNTASAVTTTNPIIQGLIGTGLNVANGVEGLVSGLASKLLR